MNYPEINEVVICKITKITDFGVFAELLEYEDLAGFVHISQISSTWIKNIHNHVKVGQIRAAKILKIDREKNNIDLSLSRVNQNEEKRKVSDYRLFLRAQSLLKVVAKELNISLDIAWKEIADPIFEKENSLYKGFVNIVKFGFKNYNIDPKYRKPLLDIFNKNIKIKDKNIQGVITIDCPKSDAIELIKKILLKIIKKYKNSKIIYIAPGKYSLVVTEKDIKVAAKSFEEISKELEKGLKKNATVKIEKKE
jgi:translation initiation factor 2 subunit 1